MTLDWYAQHFWIPSLRYSGQGYQYQLWKYFLECFVGNIWDHAKWRKAIQKFMCPILLKCICWMTVKIWFSCNASWYLMWKTECKQIYLRKPLIWRTFWKSSWLSIHWKESKLFRDSYPATTFNLLGREVSCSNCDPTVQEVLRNFLGYVYHFQIVNVCIASFTVNNSRILMWYLINWDDHISPVDVPLQVAVQPFGEASVCIRTCAGGWINDWSFERSRFVDF